MIAIATSIPTTPAVRLGVPAAEYHRRELGVVTTGALKAMLRTPAHYLAWATGEKADEDTAALRFGTLLHTAVLEPLRFASSVVIEPAWGDRRYKDEKARHAEWLKANAGREPISAQESRDIGGMGLSLAGHPVIARLLADVSGVREAVVEWVDEETGLRCKCRPDLWSRAARLILDIKTTQSAAPGRFAWAARDFGYDLQAAHYLAGLEAVGDADPGFIFAAIEKEPPFAVAVYTLADEALAEARAARREAMQQIADGLRTGEWTGYGDEIETLTLRRRT